MITCTPTEFARRRQDGGWALIAAFRGDFQAFADCMGGAAVDGVDAPVRAAVQPVVAELQAKLQETAGTTGRVSGGYSIQLDRTDGMVFVSLAVQWKDSFVWECRLAAVRPPVVVPADGAACLEGLAPLALGARPGVRLRFSDQADKAFMWRAPAIHPLQALENAYQREVREAEQTPHSDPMKMQSEALSRYFMQGESLPESSGQPPSAQETGAFAAVRMNHLIPTFYLFRLLVRYEVDADGELDDDLRAELSSALTKLLHNGNRAQMGWVTTWLALKIGALGRAVNALNRRGERRVIFFVKGGRALNYFLGTPQNGENDWDTQVVINPTLPAKDWYACLVEVHDTVLAELGKYKVEFRSLVQDNAVFFAAFLNDKAAPDVGEDDEPDENDLSDLSSRRGHANCKAELIDVGVPRRDSSSGLEEWRQLSADGALLQSDGIYYPHREYYINEYLMMVRDAFLPNADVTKAPKRITRFGLALATKGHGLSEEGALQMQALPRANAAIQGMPNHLHQELFLLIMLQFAAAYNLDQDGELAAAFDEMAEKLMFDPPPLPQDLAAVLDAGQQTIALDVGVAHALSEQMKAHWDERDAFFRANEREVFAPLLHNLVARTSKALSEMGAQFAIAGSYAAALHARHLGLRPTGLEPIRRILVKLQCLPGQSEAVTLAAVREAIKDAVADHPELKIMDLPDAKKRSIVLFWHRKEKIGTLNYTPLVMKLRGAAQPAGSLPVLSAIEGLPVLDLRYVAADYLRKASKVDERGARVILALATAAVSEMLTRFDITSDDNEED